MRPTTTRPGSASSSTTPPRRPSHAIGDGTPRELRRPPPTDAHSSGGGGPTPIRPLRPPPAISGDVYLGLTLRRHVVGTAAQHLRRHHETPRHRGSARRS